MVDRSKKGIVLTFSGTAGGATWTHSLPRKASISLQARGGGRHDNISHALFSFGEVRSLPDDHGRGCCDVALGHTSQ